MERQQFLHFNRGANKSAPNGKTDKGTGLVMMCSAETTQILGFVEQGIKPIISIDIQEK